MTTSSNSSSNNCNCYSRKCAECPFEQVGFWYNPALGRYILSDGEPLVTYQAVFVAPEELTSTTLMRREELFSDQARENAYEAARANWGSGWERCDI
jgi:hypothetical protein